MKWNAQCLLSCAVTCVLLAGTARADLLVLSNGRIVDGKIESESEKEVVFRLDGSPNGAEPRHVDRAAVVRTVYCDENGAVLPGPATKPATPAARWTVPPAPAAQPVVEPPAGKSTYYVIPLHGEVGATVLASALEKSLADAVSRKPMVIVLDIDSPGGLVEESLKIMKVIAHYNKQCKIVAYIEQDLSAAAVFTLSCRQIYVKQLSTIGAATSFIPGRPDLAAKIEEKMQSAWRAAARNSAEEGRHDPLIADAMIDSDTELHVETTNGKPVIKEGPGEHMLVRKGKVLTLTSHEAVECGLAAGEADDLDELGKVMGYPSWVECKGLGRELAEYLPKHEEAFEQAIKKIGADLSMHLQSAIEADPTGSQEFVEQVQQRVVPGPGPVGPGYPRYPVPGRGYFPVPQNQIITRRVITRTDPREWKSRALACVANFQLVEGDLTDALAALHDFGHDADMGPLKDLKTKVSALREATFKDRNKYAAQLANQPAVAQPQNPVGQAPPPAQGTTPRPKVAQLAALSSDTSIKTPQPADAEAKLKQIAIGWQDQKSNATSLVSKVIGLSATRGADDTLHLSAGGVVASPEYYGPNVTFRAVVMSSGKQTRINCGGSAIFFNSTMHSDELRLYSGPANGKHKQGAGLLEKDQWVGMEFMVTPQEMVIYVDGAERYRAKGDFSNIHQQFAIRADNGDIWVKSIEVIQSK
jgi:ATP-dependent protease ClpP protease subunit